MADRFPLILNTNANQIQEIASGDTLDLSNNNISNAGIITASSFSGPIVAGAGVSNITAGIITATEIDLNGDLDVDGHTNLDNVSVAGVTTTTGVVVINGVTQSTNSTSGALRVAGGAGIAKNVNVGGDLDVDGHTNLDNLSVAGVSTFTGNADFSAGVDVTGDINVTSTLPVINLIDSNNNDDFAIKNVDGVFTIRDATNGADRLTINSNGKATFPNDVELSSTLTIESTQPTIQLNDTNANDDFAIRNVDGVFGVRDITNGADRFTINSSGVVNIPGNLDCGAGIDVTGNLIASGNLTANNGTVTVSGTAPKITFTETNDNPDYKLEANGGNIAFVDTTNSATRLSISSSGINVTGNGTFSGNVSVGGVLTYEDVTNVDSVGIVTARKGIQAGGNTAISGTPHTYKYGRGNEGGGLSIYAGEAAAEIVSSDSGGHGSSFLVRSPTEGFGFNHNPSTNSLDIKSFTSSADNFTIHDPSGTDVSSVKDCIRMRKGSSVSLYHNGVGVVTTTSTGATINQLEFSQNTIKRSYTNSRIVFHGSNETRLYHAANSQIKLAFRGNGDVFRGAVDASAGYIQLKTGADESAVVARDNGFTELYYDGNKKLNTENGGVFITGICTATAYYGDGSNLTGIVSDKIFEGDTEVECVDTGSGGEVTIKADNTDVLKVIKGSESHIGGKVGINQFSNRKSPLTVAHSHPNAVQVNLSLTSTGVNAPGGGTAIFMKSSNDITAERRYGTLIKSERSSNNNGSPDFIIEKENAAASGLAEHFRIDAAGQVLPGADNSQNLGSSTKRWANIYSADIHCSNKGSSNDVDGTWGDFTIQEGESDLFLINNRNGKKYKFNLTEVN